MRDILEDGEGFSRLYAGMVNVEARVSEGAPGGHDLAIREKLVRCLWFDQFLDMERLQTADGAPLALHWPGHWNEGQGPDFLNAELSFGDGPRQRGDVEVHIAASGWKAHGHASDPAYGKVILHVVLDNDLATPFIQQDSRAIPQLVLRDYLSADLAELLASLDPAAYPATGCGREGMCARSIRAMGRDERWIGRFLDIAGDERMLRKASRFITQIEGMTPDEAVYRALLDAMGYSANRRGFRMLAQRLPLDILRRYTPCDGTLEERLAHAQGILFGAAGFLASVEEARLDPASRAYLVALTPHWERIQSERGLVPLEPSAWTAGRIRPLNHPLRRLAGIAGFLATHLHRGICRAMMETVESAPRTGPEGRRCRETLVRFQNLLEGPPQPYWDRRIVFGAEKLSHPSALIGPTRTTEVIVNVVVPLLLALSQRERNRRLEQRLHNMYSIIRPLADNSVTERMKSHLFPAETEAKRVVRSARRQQGLLQLYHDFCEDESMTCTDCGFLAAVERVEA
jgi:hypothetical protein